jgi:hypothetical protein
MVLKKFAKLAAELRMGIAKGRSFYKGGLPVCLLGYCGAQDIVFVAGWKPVEGRLMRGRWQGPDVEQSRLTVVVDGGGYFRERGGRGSSRAF